MANCARQQAISRTNQNQNIWQIGDLSCLIEVKCKITIGNNLGFNMEKEEILGLSFRMDMDKIMTNFNCVIKLKYFTFNVTL